MLFFTFDVLAQTALDSHPTWLCSLLSRTSDFVPSSPVTMSGLSAQIGDSLPFVGGALVYAALYDIFRVLSVVVFWKIFKAIPGKFS